MLRTKYLCLHTEPGNLFVTIVTTTEIREEKNSFSCSLPASAASCATVTKQIRRMLTGKP